jgi:hypothetical protein
VLRMLDPKALDAAFGQRTAKLVAALVKGGVLAIDGKSLNGAYEKGEKSSPRMMVSAYCRPAPHPRRGGAAAMPARWPANTPRQHVAPLPLGIVRRSA